MTSSRRAGSGPDRDTDRAESDTAPSPDETEPAITELLELARILRAAGWAPVPSKGPPAEGDSWPVGIPATCLSLDTRFLLRLRFAGSESGPNAIDQAVSVARSFTREGGHLVDLGFEDDHASLLVVPTVRQAMAVLAEHKMSSGTLEAWLRYSGFTGDVKHRIEHLVGELLREAAELDSELAAELASLVSLPDTPGTDYVH